MRALRHNGGQRQHAGRLIFLRSLFPQIHSHGEKGGGNDGFQHSPAQGVLMKAEGGIKKPCRGAYEPDPVEIPLHLSA